MFCGNCGGRNDDDAVFCEVCGENLEQGQFDDNLPPDSHIQNKKKKAVILACVAGFVIFFVAGNVSTDPFRLAKTYAAALYRQDYSSIYPLLDVKNTGFTSRKMFEKMLSKSVAHISAGNIVNYEVIDPSRDESSSRRSSGENELTKSYVMQYVLKDSGRTQTHRITFIRQKGNKLFFFPKWTIANNSVIANNYSIRVPSGATVTFDDNVRLGKEYLSDDTTDRSLGYYDTYVIPAIFIGEYEVQASLPYATAKQNIRASNNGSATIEGFGIKDDSVNELIKKVVDNHQKIYSAAISGRAFKEVSNLFISDDSIQQNTEKQYDSFRENITREGNRILKINFSNPSSSRQANVQQGTVIVSMTLKADYTRENTSWNNVSTVERSAQNSIRVQFVYRNGQWYQTGWSILRV